MMPNLSKTSDAFLHDAGSAVDCHFHVFAENVAVAGARYCPSYAAELKDWIVKAQASGVQRGLLVQPSFLGTDNSQMLRALATSGHALRGVAVIDPATPASEVHAMHAQGVRGIRLNLAGINHDVRAWRQADELWLSMKALGWHLELHTDQGALPDVLMQLLPAIPATLCLVLDHFGWIGFAQKPINAARVAGVLMVLGGLVLVARH